VTTDATSEPSEPPTGTTVVSTYNIIQGTWTQGTIFDLVWDIPCISFIQPRYEADPRPLHLHGLRPKPSKHDNRKHRIKTAAMKRRFKSGRF
jgi:hypothetical protein